MIIHQAGCTLHPMHWLRHAAGHLAQENPDAHADRLAVMSLTDMLAHFAELNDWATVTLRDVANHATLMNQEMNQERFKHMCTCGAFD